MMRESQQANAAMKRHESAASREVADIDEDAPSSEDELAERARDGDVEALLAWRELLEPIDYEELGCGG